MSKAPGLVPNDPLYPQQWHFALIGGTQGQAGMEELWNSYTGAGVSVGIYDDGIDFAHEDLAANYDASLHFTTGGVTYGGAFQQPGVHGTAVAGIVAAAGDNDTGVVGVAWGASLTSVNLLADGIGGLQNEVAAMQWAGNFDVMNNSWGYSDLFASGQDLYGSGWHAQDAASFAHVATFGRDGLGTIVVKSAGNESTSADGEAPNLARWSITVGAVDSNGDKFGYSNFGHSLLISAPAASVTTDVTGSAGYASGNYTQTFGGTSAAGPVVAGVAALMLEANPNLGWADVQEILALSASHTGSDFGQAASGFEPAAWFSNGAATWNGGGLSYSTSYGYGMVNAPAAVHLAESWAVIFDTPRTSENELSFSDGTGTIDAPIGLDGPLEITFEIEGALVISAIEFTLSMTHDYPGALEMSLISEDGTEFAFYDGAIDASIEPGAFDWTFVIQAANGMASEGTWTLVIENFEPEFGETGTLHSAELALYGYSTDMPTVYTFTDDFLHYAAVEEERTTIGDGDTSDAWLNLAAVTGFVEVNLGTDGAFAQEFLIRVDGDVWATDGADFGNLYLGYGGSVVVGNELDNVIHAAGGANEIWGEAGNNTLIGGDGDDTIFGGTGDDSIRGGGGDDLIDLREGGNNVVWGVSGNNTIYGGAGDDTINGSVGNNLIDVSAGGNNTVWAQAGDDTIIGGAGNDTIGAGNGNNLIDLREGGDNVVSARPGNDTIHGGAGNDSINGGVGDNVIDMSAGGNNIVWARAGDDTIIGGAGDDRIGGGEGNNFIDVSAGGNNVVYGRPGDDTLIGGAGNDTLWGGAGNNLIDASAGGDNRIWGRAGSDTIIGGAGDDTITAGSGDNILTGGGGADVFVFWGRNEGDTMITDFDAADTLRLNTWIWREVGVPYTDPLSAQDVVDTFGAINADGDAVLDFGDLSITLQGYTLDDLADQIVIA